MSEPIKRVTHGVGDEFLREIGNVVVNFAQLEMSIEVAICSILECGADQQSAILSNMQFSTKVDLLNALYRQLEEPPISLNDFSEVLKEIEEVRKLRNDINHCFIQGIGDDELFLHSHSKRKRSKGVQSRSETWSLESTKLLNDRIQKVSGRVVDSWVQHGIGYSS